MPAHEFYAQAAAQAMATLSTQLAHGTQRADEAIRRATDAEVAERMARDEAAAVCTELDQRRQGWLLCRLRWAIRRR